MNEFHSATRAAGSNLFNAGDAADKLFVIQSGTVELIDAKTGAVFATVGAGQSLGEQALVPGGIRGATARASTDVELLEISPNDLVDLMKRQSPLMAPMLEALMLQQSMANSMRRD